MNLVLLPVIISFFAAAFCFGFWFNRRIARTISLVASLINLPVAILLLNKVSSEGILTASAAGWPAPFGIVFVADILSALMVLVTAIIGATVLLYSWFCLDQELEENGFHPFYHTLLLGVYGSFLTGDVFNLYVFFEVMLIASFVMLALPNKRHQLEGALKYMAMSLVGSLIFLAGAGILYGLTGTLNMADLVGRLQIVEEPGLISLTAVLFLVAFSLKCAAFPFFFWLPAAYPTAPSAVAAVFAGLLTKVGVYAMLRFFTLIFILEQQFTHTIIICIALSSMILGVLGAVSQMEIRRILSFHIISQIGYMLLGLGIYTVLSITATIFYLFHHIIVKANLFLIAGLIHRISGSYKLKNNGGLYKSHPFLALLFLIPALSLAGIPPLSGFFAKLLLIIAGISDGRPFSVFVMLIVGLFTLISMLKIFDYAFWSDPPAERNKIELSNKDYKGMFVPIAILALLTVILGVYAPWLYTLAERAAEQLLNNEEYVTKVLGA